MVPPSGGAPGVVPQNSSGLSAVKLALLARERRARGDDLDRSIAEPIAVIGMSCRFPGGATTPDGFWRVLRDGVDGIGAVPPDRWDVDALYDADQAAPGKMTTRWGGFLQQVDGFDATFFGISPREAERMDPQQRLVLEVAYEAFERAGQTRERLAGSDTGIFLASYHNDYQGMQVADLETIDAYTSTGTAHSIASNRLSFLLNLRGPSLTVDTACSSSLVSVHLACQSLRQDECSMALAGGVSLILAPDVTISLSKWGFMAPDGRCKTFDARANGFVRGEGCGVVVLKRLADALADRDPILGVIRGSAVNQDGRTNVLTAPNGLAQQAAIRRALQSAGLAPGEITYVEAHGTGTTLGDPIEVEALAEVLGQPRPDVAPCVLGAVKTNIGHLEAAAGIAGLIKVLLCLQFEAIPPNVHFTSLNPHISLNNTRFVIPTRLHPWARGARRRIAGVSSFGFGGTNAHVLVEEAPEVPLPEVNGADGAPRTIHLLPLSAQSEPGLRSLAQAYREFLIDATATDEPRLSDICYTAAVRRTHYDHRLALVGGSGQEMIDRLEMFLRGEQRPGLAAGSRRPGERQKLAFVFSGQGPQWWAMGRELLAEEATFRASIERCDELLRAHTRDWSLLAELTASEEESRLAQTEIAQPALLALQVGLAALWRAWGIIPDAVVGHSVGEIAAAHVAGALSLEEAVAVAFHRGRLMQRATGAGAMASVDLPRERAEQAIMGLNDRLSVAAINSPTNSVLSGEPAALEHILESLGRQDIRVRRLSVNYAFHSVQMAAFQEDLRQSLDGLAPRRATTRIASTVTGEALDGPAWDAEYWSRNVRQPVRFSDAMASLIEQGHELFLEISPHPVLASSMTECLGGREQAAVLASLRRGRSDREVMLSSLGELYARGYSIVWQGVPAAPGRCVSLPPYPWQRERYWLPARRQRPAAPLRVSASAQPVHPLLGERLRSPAIADVVFQVQLAQTTPVYLGEHRILGSVPLPATAYLEMALASTPAALEGAPGIVEGFEIHQPLVLPDGGSRTVQIHLHPEEDSGAAAFQIFALRDDERWDAHASGKIRARSNGADHHLHSLLAQARAMCSEEVPVSAFYADLGNRGIEFGAAFRGVERLWRGDSQVLAHVALPAARVDKDDYHAHPAVLDAALQPLGALLPASDTYLPIGIERLRIYQKLPVELWAYGHLRLDHEQAEDLIIGDVLLLDDAGQVLAEASGLQLKRASRGTLSTSEQTGGTIGGWFHHLSWQPSPRRFEGPLRIEGRVLIFADESGIAKALGEAVAPAGAGSLLVVPGADFERVNDGEWRIDPSQPAHMLRLLSETSSDVDPIRHVVHLWSLNTPSPEQSATFLPDAQIIACGSVLHLLQALASMSKAPPPDVWLVTRGAQPVGDRPVRAVEQAPLWGLGSTIVLEHPDLRCVRVDLDPEAAAIDSSQLLLQEIASPDGNLQVGFRDGVRLVSRVEPMPLERTTSGAVRESPPVHLELATRGTLDKLELRPAQRRAPGPGEIELRVLASGLNFRDVLNVLGLYPGEAGPLGGECVGEVVAVGPDVAADWIGRTVLGLAPGTFGSYVTTRLALVAPKPARLTVEEAATIPIAFLTAHYALHHVAQLQPGERVLIHAAAGGVGLAAVQLAQRIGAEIFATAGSPAKQAYLHQLGIKHVMGSRTLAFADAVRERTGGRGVDVVLNSLAGDFIPASLAACADDGRFVEIGRTGIWESESVARRKPGVAYSALFLGDLVQGDPASIQATLRELLPRFETGELEPLPRRAFPLSQAVSAFRYMAQAKHIGKIVIVPPPGDTTGTVVSECGIHASGTYLVTGGLGGLGLRVADWLVQQGARHLVLMSRRGPVSAADQEMVGRLEATGAQVCVVKADVRDADDVQQVLAQIHQSMPPLRGIIHAAGVVDDGILIQQEWRRCADVLAPKLAGAWNLHRLSRACELDFFVCFSSAAATLGSVGQGSYAAANAFLDALANFRHASGLPALSIGWGPWANIGMTARLGTLDEQRWARQGVSAMQPERALQAFGIALRQNAPHILVTPLAKSAAPDRDMASPDLMRRWRETSANQRRSLVLAHIRSEAIRVMGLPQSQPIAPRQPLNELGLDSLLAVELRNALSAAVGCPLPATLLFDYPTSEGLADYLTEHILTPATGDRGMNKGARLTAAVATEVAQLRKLSEEEAEALLLAELANGKNGH